MCVRACGVCVFVCAGECVCVCICVYRWVCVTGYLSPGHLPL